MKIAYTGAYLATQPNRVKSAYALTDAGLQQVVGTPSTPAVASEKTVKLTDVLGGFSGGGAAAGSLKMYQLGNTSSHQEIVQYMVTNNVSPSYADPWAKHVLDIVNSVGGKAVFIGLSGGTATFGVLEVIKPHWSLEKKALWSLGAALVVSAIYLILVQLGVMR